MIKVNKDLFNELLISEKISVGKFAKKLDVSRSQLWRVLNDKSNPGVEFIAKFKNAYPKKRIEDYFFVEGVA